MENYKTVLLPLLGSVVGSYVWYSIASTNQVGLCDMNENLGNLTFKKKEDCHKNILGASVFSGLGALGALFYLKN